MDPLAFGMNKSLMIRFLINDTSNNKHNTYNKQRSSFQFTPPCHYQASRLACHARWRRMCLVSCLPFCYTESLLRQKHALRSAEPQNFLLLFLEAVSHSKATNSCLTFCFLIDVKVHTPTPWHSGKPLLRSSLS